VSARLPAEGLAAVRVLVVGDIMLDRYWLGDVERISPEAPVPVIGVSETEERPGGAGNVAANVTALGARCQLLSFVGDDEAGRRLNDLLGKARIDRHLHIDPSSRTTEKLRIVSRNQQLLRADFEQRPDEEILERSLEDYSALLSEASIVVISDYGKGGLAYVETMISIAGKAGVPIIVDPKGIDFARYRGATLVTPNLKEFEAVAGQVASEEDFEIKAAAMLEKYGFGALLVTLGEKGMVLFRPGAAKVYRSAHAREVFDVSGAGDTVVAVAAIGFAANLPWADTLELATRAASAVVTRFGTSVATPADLETSDEGNR